jgi:hypothetical protein
MSVGAQASSGTVDQDLTDLTVSWRNLATRAANLNTWINGGGNGLAYLEQLGYSSAGNPDNPGGISDAQYALNIIGYLNSLSGVFFGTATQGSEFDFANALAPLCAGQLS